MLLSECPQLRTSLSSSSTPLHENQRSERRCKMARDLHPSVSGCSPLTFNLQKLSASRWTGSASRASLSPTFLVASLGRGLFVCLMPYWLFSLKSQERRPQFVRAPQKRGAPLGVPASAWQATGRMVRFASATFSPAQAANARLLHLCHVFTARKQRTGVSVYSPSRLGHVWNFHNAFPASSSFVASDLVRVSANMRPSAALRSFTSSASSRCRSCSRGIAASVRAWSMSRSRVPECHKLVAESMHTPTVTDAALNAHIAAIGDSCTGAWRWIHRLRTNETNEADDLIPRTRQLAFLEFFVGKPFLFAMPLTRQRLNVFSTVVAAYQRSSAAR